MFRLSRFSPRPEPRIPTVFERDADGQMQMAKIVREAVAEDRLCLAFQPVVSSRNTQLPAFHECLARIVGRDGTALPGAGFIAAVEGTDLGRIVDRVVLAKALEILADTQRVRLSVNLSAHGVGDPLWLKILEDACEASPASGEFLIVEITETAVLEMTAQKRAFLDRVRALGCSIALDDFGAGHTSMAQLSQFRFDFMKIDGSFVQEILISEDKRFLMQSMVSIARHFEMVSVAEMVDSAEKAELLATIGIDCLQGYAFGEPALAPEWLTGAGGQRAWLV